MKIRLSEYEEGVVDGREESAETIHLQQSEIKALTAHIINLTKGTIRQQQEEIEVLKQQLVTTSSEAKLNYNKGHEDGRKLAVVKQITDEEILAISNENYIENKGGDIEFARAILRKAQK